jgi:hypothetical protein
MKSEKDAAGAGIVPVRIRLPLCVVGWGSSRHVVSQCRTRAARSRVVAVVCVPNSSCTVLWPVESCEGSEIKVTQWRQRGMSLGEATISIHSSGWRGRGMLRSELTAVSVTKLTYYDSPSATCSMYPTHISPFASKPSASTHARTRSTTVRVSRVKPPVAMCRCQPIDLASSWQKQISVISCSRMPLRS